MGYLKGKSRKARRYRKCDTTCQVKKITKKLNRMMPETKFFQFSSNTLTSPYGSNNTNEITANLPVISNYATTSDFNFSPVGRSVNPMYMDVGFNLRQVGAATRPATARVVIIQSKHRFVPSSGSTDFNSSGSVWNWNGTHNSETMHSPFNFNNRKNFKVLYDRRFAFGDTGVSPENYVIKKRIKLSGKIKWDADGNMESGAIYLIRISDVSSGSPSMDGFVSTLYYKDP